MGLLAPLYRIQRLVWRVVRPRTRGVKVMLLDETGAVLLVRHTYGRTDQYLLPGGGIRPFEQPEAAARREMREELNCAITDLAFVASYLSTNEGKRDTVFLYRARPTDPIRVDGVEVAEAGFFALDALPETVSPATLRRIDEMRGARAVSESW